MKKIFSSILFASLFIGAFIFTSCKNDVPTEFEARGTYYYKIINSNPTEMDFELYYEVDNKFYEIVEADTDGDAAIIIIDDLNPIEEKYYEDLRESISNDFTPTKAIRKTFELDGITFYYAVDFLNYKWTIILESMIQD